MVIYCISMQWFREWEGFVKGKDNGNWTEVLPFHSPTPLHPLVLFKCLIKKVKCFPCDLLWRDRVSGTNCPSIRFHRHMGGKKANRLFSFFSYRKSKLSGFYKQLIFKRNCGVPVPSFDFFLQRIRFSPPSRVSILLQQNEASKCISLVFHLSSYFCFPYFVLSHLFITACIWHACKCLFFFFLLTSAPLIFVFSL